MNWERKKNTKNHPFSIEVWKETYTLNEKTILSIRKISEGYLGYSKGYPYMISSSRNLYIALRNFPIKENDMFRFNDIAVETYERAKEIIEDLKIQAGKCPDFEQTTVFIKTEQLNKYENNEIVDGYFHQTKGTIPILLKDDHINQAMQDNDMAAIKKNGWTKQELDNFYDNF